MSKHVRQHIVPRVYLQYFATESFVHVLDTTHPYKNHVERKGVRDKVFTRENYYDTSHAETKKFLEETFSRFEDKYNEIISRLRNKQNLGLDTKNLLITWLHMTKMRSSFVRRIASTVFDNLEDSDGQESKTNKQDGGKIFQLSMFSLDEYRKTLKEYSDDFRMKDWVILSSDDHRFLTNDNPGFSMTFTERNELLNIHPAFGDFNLSDEGLIVHIFPLTSDMCLCLKPFLWTKGTTEKKMLDDVNRDIRFELASTEFIQLINESVIRTKDHLIISKQKEDIERFLKKTS